MFERIVTVLLAGDATVEIPKRCPECSALLDTTAANLQTFSRVEHWAHENAEGDVEEDGQEDWSCEEIQCKNCEHKFLPTEAELRKAYAQIQTALNEAIGALNVCPNCKGPMRPCTTGEPDLHCDKCGTVVPLPKETP